LEFLSGCLKRSVLDCESSVFEFVERSVVGLLREMLVGNAFGFVERSAFQFLVDLPREVFWICERSVFEFVERSVCGFANGVF